MINFFGNFYASFVVDIRMTDLPMVYIFIPVGPVNPISPPTPPYPTPWAAAAAANPRRRGEVGELQIGRSGRK